MKNKPTLLYRKNSNKDNVEKPIEYSLTPEAVERLNSFTNNDCDNYHELKKAYIEANYEYYIELDNNDSQNIKDDFTVKVNSDGSSSSITNKAGDTVATSHDGQSRIATKDLGKSKDSTPNIRATGNDTKEALRDLKRADANSSQVLVKDNKVKNNKYSPSEITEAKKKAGISFDMTYNHKNKVKSSPKPQNNIPKPR